MSKNGKQPAAEQVTPVKAANRAMELAVEHETRVRIMEIPLKGVKNPLTFVVPSGAEVVLPEGKEQDGKRNVVGQFISTAYERNKPSYKTRNGKTEAKPKAKAKKAPAKKATTKRRPAAKAKKPAAKKQPAKKAAVKKETGGEAAQPVAKAA